MQEGLKRECFVKSMLLQMLVSTDLLKTLLSTLYTEEFIYSNIQYADSVLLGVKLLSGSGILVNSASFKLTSHRLG